MTTNQVWGGDTIEAKDGRTGTIEVTQYSLVGKETEYAIQFPGETEHPQFTTGPDGKYASGDRSHIVAAHEIVRVVAYGRHEYHPGSIRGHCGHCGIRKAVHGDGVSQSVRVVDIETRLAEAEAQIEAMQ